jgi:hypothetical protein
MSQRAFQNVRENLHIAMAVRSKSRARSDAIFVNHAQAPEAHELRVIIIGKRKRVVRVEPAMIGVTPLFTSVNLYHSESPSGGRFPRGLRPQIYPAS